MSVHRMLPLVMAFAMTSSGAAYAADAGFFPPETTPPAAVPAGGPFDSCVAGFIPLRQEAERRGKMIKAASDRHAPPDEACKLIASFEQAEIKMIKYVEINAASCGSPTGVSDQLKSGHKGTEALQKKVCTASLRMQRGGPANPTGDFDGPDDPMGASNGPS